ncbi:MAG TPA: hypothetical protein VK590_11985, partial [Saprospiraceae bacterium]|nr:hypothetical protein [Saprospiraceae bacterium]
QMEKAKIHPPLNHTYPVLIYPLLQTCFHKMHNSRQDEYNRFENSIKRNNPEEFHKEMYILANMFFQTRDFIDDFEVWVEDSDQILEIYEYKEYLKNFSKEGQELIMYSWNIIEKDLYWAFYDRDGPLEEDKNPKYNFTKDLTYDL